MPPVAYFKAPGVSRFDGGTFFAAGGNVYELRKAYGGGWDAVAVSGGLAGPVHGATQKGAIGRVWELTGSHWDVSAPVVTRREGRDEYGRPRWRADVVCEGQGLYLIENPRKGRDPWAEPCHKCHAKGYIPGYEHVDNGVCFACNGDRILMSYTLEEAGATVRRMAREARTARNRQALDAERKRRRWARFEKAHPAAAGWITEAVTDANKFAGDMRARVLKGHELTPGQREACEAAAERAAAKKREQAATEAARKDRVQRSRPAGAEGEKVTVRGTVTRAFRYTSGPKWRPVSKCGVIVDDGAGVAVITFTTARAAFELTEGDTVTITGTVKDPNHRDRDTGEIQSLIKSPKFTEHQPGE